MVSHWTVTCRADTILQDKPAATQIQAWIDDLESNTYTVRVHATEQLIAAGHAAVAPVIKAINDGGLETISRSVYVLRQLALASDDATTRADAYSGLKKISERHFTGAARRAASALATIHQIRQQNAQAHLTKRGAVFSVTSVLMSKRIHQPFVSIYFGPKWRGTLDDLKQLNWITRNQDDGAENHWMIIMEGPQVTDDWVDVLAGLENLAVVKIKFASISDASADRLAQLKRLQVLELLYNPLTDAAYDSFAKMPQVDKFRLIGNKMTRAANTAFDQRMNGIEIDFRQGGFLGVGCDNNPCRINKIQPNSVAAKAGLRIGDIISGYNDQPVQTMEELTEMIGRHAVGDTVTIELQRGNQRITREVTLGAWD
jgi:hypothetical protein